MSHVFFWRAREYPYGCLSNWYRSSFKDPNGTTFNNNEQYVMYKKAVLFDDEEAAIKILAATSPGKCKFFGRMVKNFDSKIWDTHKNSIMATGCYLKFSQNPNLKKILLGTGNSILAEASPHDKIWGIGLDQKDAKYISVDKWPGSNLLGKCLMLVRKKL